MLRLRHQGDGKQGSRAEQHSRRGSVGERWRVLAGDTKVSKPDTDLKQPQNVRLSLLNRYLME